MATPEPPPVVIIAPPPPAPAPDPRVLSEEERAERERAAADAALDNGGFALAMGTLLVQPSLGNTPFDGSGKPLNTQLTQSFHHRGRELGLDRPLMWGGEVSAHYMRRYFAVGVLAFIAGHPGGADAAIPATARSVPNVEQSALTGWGGAIDLAGAVPFGLVTFRPGVVVGLRGFTMPITGFEMTTCHTKSGTHPCYEYADTPALGYVEPRMSVIFTPGRSGVGFGAYVGMDVVNAGGPSAGLFITVGTQSHDGMRP